MKKYSALILLITAATGCVSYTALTEIEPDGSGYLAIRVEVPQSEEAYVSVTDFGITDSTEGWEMTSMSADTSDTVIVYRLEGAFASPEVLESVFGIDIMSFEKEIKGDVVRYHLSRPPVYMPATELEGYFESTESLLKTVFKYGSEKYSWTEKLVLPGEIVKNNAHKHKGDTLIWEVDVSDLINEEFMVDVVWEVPR